MALRAACVVVALFSVFVIAAIVAATTVEQQARRDMCSEVGGTYRVTPDDREWCQITPNHQTNQSEG